MNIPAQSTQNARGSERSSDWRVWVGGMATVDAVSGKQKTPLTGW
jgi:hypothetical protein